MKKTHQMLRSIAVLSLCCVLFCGTAFADVIGSFPDVPADANYTEAVETLTELGILQGDNTGKFNPNNTITRAEASAIICRMLGIEKEAKGLKKVVFSDVPSSHWAVGYVAKAVELNIIGGYGNGRYGPSNPVTQEQVIKMLVCAYDMTDAAEEAGGYPDGYIDVAKGCGMAGNISIVKTEPAKRSWVAILLYNAMYE